MSVPVGSDMLLRHDRRKTNLSDNGCYGKCTVRKVSRKPLNREVLACWRVQTQSTLNDCFFLLHLLVVKSFTVALILSKIQ